MPTDTAVDDGTAAFAAVRSRLLSIAHRILRRWSDAEDVVQDAWLRWQVYDRSTVANPTAFLVTTTTRLAINATQSARARREACVGDWLPELASAADDPARDAEHREALEQGVIELLERLAPPERAAYVLHEAFELPYPEIAEMLKTSVANARQLGSRARKHLTAGPRHTTCWDDHRRLVHAFVAATRDGDVCGLAHTLTADARRRVTAAPCGCSMGRAHMGAPTN
jgi:RNA polymerase sigma-70 factor (ECF subfamily)